MRKIILSLFVAFFAVLQVSNAQAPMLNFYITGPETTTQYDIYYEVVDINDQPITGGRIYDNYSFGVMGSPFEGSSVMVPYIPYTQPIPSPKVWCRVKIGIVPYNSTDPQNDVLAGGVSDFMSFEELTTSAKLVKVRL